MNLARKAWPWICAAVLLSAPLAGAGAEGPPVLRGPYFGQEPTGVEAKLFAPDIISTGLHDDGGPAFSPDGRYLFFTSFRHEGREYSSERWTYDAWMRFNSGPNNGRGGDVYWVSTKAIRRLAP